MSEKQISTPVSTTLPTTTQQACSPQGLATHNGQQLLSTLVSEVDLTTFDEETDLNRLDDLEKDLFDGKETKLHVIDANGTFAVEPSLRFLRLTHCQLKSITKHKRIFLMKQKQQQRSVYKNRRIPICGSCTTTQQAIPMPRF